MASDVNSARRMGVFYAGVFLGVGVMMTFLPLHLRLLGMTASMTGAIFAARTLTV